MDLKLDDHVVVVTGGTSGIGLAVVDMLLAEGANVATCGRDPGRIDAVKSAHLGRALFATRCDVRRSDQVAGFIDATHDHFGRIDGLVNNAGQSRMKSFAEVVWDDWTDELELKFASVLHPLNAALEHLIASRDASVVNINAVLARQPETHLITTSAARAGILNLSKNLATDLAADGVRVNSVCLGLIESKQWHRRYNDADTGQSFQEWTAELAAERGVPLRRIGTPDEVAAVICFLLSPVSSYLTGTSIDVSGGVGRYV